MKKVCAQILIVDDNEEMCSILSLLMKREGFKAEVALDGETALKVIAHQDPDVVMVDVNMPEMNGIDVLRQAKELDRDLPVIMITGYAGVSGAVEAMRLGAHDYIAKPFNNNEVIRVVRRALAERELKRKIKTLSRQLKEQCSLKEAMGSSAAIARLVLDVNRVAKSDFAVVIIGETGSGKELVARTIHHASHRSKGPFVPVDCGAIPETLLETELFGHEKGAFTGAGIQKLGKVEMAQSGTLFLDEISNMPLGSQAKLLRVIQDKTIYHVGGNKPLNIESRFMVASNQDLESMVETGSFRRDLFYRLSEFTITIPPLRKRKEDISYLAKRFLDTTNVELAKNVKGFSESAIEALLGYDWPGNVRQLRSTIRRAVLLADEVITEKHLDMKRVPVPGLTFTPKVQGQPWNSLSLKEILRLSTQAVEREVIVQVLKNTGGNKARAARILRIDYKTIHTKVKQLGIQINGGEQ